MPEASQAFHPSDIINQYLLNKEPSANIAITHDDEWIALLEKNVIRSEDLVQGSLLEGLVSQNYNVVLEADAVYLRSSDSGTSNISEADATMECDSDSTAEIPSTELGDVTTSQTPQDISPVNPMRTNLDRIVEPGSSIPSNDPQDAGGVARSAVSLHQETLPDQEMTGVQDRHSHTTIRYKTTRSTLSMSGAHLDDIFTKTSPRPSSLRLLDEVDPEPAGFQRRGKPGQRVSAATRYVPPLKPTSTKYVGGTVKLHPLLAALPIERGKYPSWVMCFRARQEHFKIVSTESWLEARTAPATQPHLTSISIVNSAFPGEIHAWAQVHGQAVTCGEVLDAIFEFLDHDMEWEEYERFVRERFNATAKRVAGDTLKRSHWLGTGWFFGGLVANDAFVKERYGDVSPSCFELICLRGTAYY